MGRTGLPTLIPALVAAAITAVVLPAVAGATSQKQVYKWVDQSGVVHYGDAIPPQYADQDKTVLNSQGVAVGTIAGSRTPEQQAAAAAKQAADEQVQRTAAESRQRDQTLLATYLTVEEIESLRDRRAEILDGQARVMNTFLEQMLSKQHDIEAQARRFRPYNPNGPVLPERLAEDLVRTTTDVSTQQHNLEAKQQELATMKAQFAADIARFRELKSSEAARARLATH